MNGIIKKLKDLLQLESDSEKKVFEAKKQVKKSKKTKIMPLKPRENKPKKIELLPVRVSRFDELIQDKGIERSSTVLIAGGTGTGKTTFCLQSIYHGLCHGEKAVFISFEEDPEKIKQHMLKNFGWDFYKFENEGRIAFLRLDPAKIARSVESIIAAKSGSLKIKVQEIELPFKPDRICVDSLSALSIAFEEEDNYRKYIKELFELLENYNSVNFVIAETEQDPKIYSKTGVEEFLADAVIVFYNIKVGEFRRNALEILKIRSSKHLKRMIPYKLGSDGFDINIPKDADF